jgi:hypothetical protein
MLTGQPKNLVIDPATAADADHFAADAPWAARFDPVVAERCHSRVFPPGTVPSATQ